MLESVYFLFRKLTLWMLREEIGLCQHHQNCLPGSVLLDFWRASPFPSGSETGSSRCEWFGPAGRFRFVRLLQARAFSGRQGRPAVPHSRSGRPAVPEGMRWEQRDGSCSSRVLCCRSCWVETVITANPATVCCIQSLNFPLMWFL